METTITNRLPGIEFRTEPAPSGPTLPRMDVAAFAGFASAGPLHTPVPVEDMAQFRSVFGKELDLAWDPVSKRVQRSLLGSAVNAFFQNGGKRCWIVRVGDNSARANAFVLPGLVAVDETEDGPLFLPAVARARSEGSWSDSLRAGTVRQSVYLHIFSIRFSDDAYELEVSAESAVSAGDLLQLTFADDHMQLFLAVDKVEKRAEERIRGGRAAIRLKAKKRYFFLRNPPVQLPADGVVKLPVGENKSIQVPCLITFEDHLYHAELAVTAEQAPEPGSVLCITLPGSPARQLLLVVKDVKIGQEDSSPPHSCVTASGDQLYWPLAESEGRQRLETASPPESPVGEHLTFQVSVWQEEKIISQLGTLAFFDAASRFWNLLPSDQEIFDRKNQDARGNVPYLPDEFRNARFPMAGLRKGRQARLHLPLGMATSNDYWSSCGPLAGTEPENALRRNGLDNFTAGLFIDPDLAHVTTRALLAEAEYKYYLKPDEPTSGDKPRAAREGMNLKGLHSLLPIEEVTLVAVPDAVHIGWKPDEPLRMEILEAPKLKLQAGKTGCEICWSKVSGAATYILEESEDPAFSTGITRFATDNTKIFITAETMKCPRQRYYRVHASRSSINSPWSNTVSAILPPACFNNCLPAMNPPELMLFTDNRSTYLSWSLSGAQSGIVYTLQEADDPQFITASIAYVGPELSFITPAKPGCYYRVRGARNGYSPWSNTVSVQAQPAAAALRMKRPDEYRDEDANVLLDVHRALLRFCAARGDMLAVLALPRHFTEEETLAHAAALKAYSTATKNQPQHAPPIGLDEERAFSFGALYAPWIYAGLDSGHGREGGIPVPVPPDGAICGTMAACALRRGAWIAPANIAIAGATSLNEWYTHESWSRLAAARVNVVHQDSRGFLTLSADTLSTDSGLRAISARRLLILLRKVALRQGALYVFESNNNVFRRMVQHSFNRLMSDLYLRGAFAGKTPDEAYQVVAEETINTPDSIDRGRFVMELKVAPSQPMTFLTVRLLQTDSAGFTMTEA